MKEQFVDTENYTKLKESLAMLKTLPRTMDRFGLGYGNYGLGKSFILERITAKENAILLRVMQSWTVKALLRTLCKELGLDINGNAFDLQVRVTEELRASPRIIIIDEIDYILTSKQRDVLELVRDIHDQARVITYMIGMEQADAKLRRNQHYHSRITEFVKFKPTCARDIEKFCELSEVRLEADLIDYFTTQHPNLRLVKKFIVRLEAEAEKNDLESVNLATFKRLGVENAGRE